MRKTGLCPKCGGGEIIHLSQVSDQAGRAGVAPLGAVVNRGRVDVVGGVFGRFQACICAACGFTEWYTENPADLLVRFPGLPVTRREPFR